MQKEIIISDSIELLKAMIEIPSLSREENEVVDYLEEKFRLWFRQEQSRKNLNIVAQLRLAPSI